MTAYPAEIPVHCDGGRCSQSVKVLIPFRHEGLMPWSGHYDGHPHTIAWILRHTHGWIVVFEKHFCSRECAQFAARPVKEVTDAQ